MTEVTERRLFSVPLVPGEAPAKHDLIPPPDGCRWETYAEFKCRVRATEPDLGEDETYIAWRIARHYEKSEEAQVSDDTRTMGERLAEDYSAVLKKCAEFVATVLPDEDSRNAQACKLILDEVRFAYLQAKVCGASDEDAWAHVAVVVEALRQEFRGQEAAEDAEHEAQVERLVAAFRKGGNEAGAESLQRKLDELRAKREG